MSRRAIAIASCLISLLFISAIWQFAETDIHAFIERTWGKISGRPFNQIDTVDDNGIPMQLYRNGQSHYNPLFIANDAKREYYRSRNLGQVQRFIQLTDWLLANGSETDSTFLLSYDFDLPQYEQSKPWSSALAQSVVMNALAHRASFERNLEIYAKAIKTLNTLDPDRANLGYAINDSSYWYMEYPASEPYWVLNGMMGVLLELYYYYDLTEDPLAQELFEKGFIALEMKLPEFDFHGYSRYDLNGTMAGRMYHQKHIRQLAKLQELRPSAKLEYYQKRWTKADSYPVLWQILLNPRPKRIIAFLLPFLLLWGFSFLLLAGKRRKAQSDPVHS